jgi:hypothetical protein
MSVEGRNRESTSKATVRMHMGLHVTGIKDMTQEGNHILVWKDIGGKMRSDRPRRLNASIRQQRPSNGSDIGSTPTGIDAVSILVYSKDSDGPITVSSGIYAASLSDSSLGSEVLFCDGLEHDLLQID